MKLFIKRTLAMCHFSPTWVVDVYNRDKTHPDAKSNPKKFFNKNLKRNIIYSLVIYIFIIIGLFNICKEIYIKREVSAYDKFLILNILSILYFIAIAGFWGNAKYFIPCIISLSFFFAYGFDISKNFFKKTFIS